MPPKGDYLLDVQLRNMHLIHKVETNKMRESKSKDGMKEEEKREKGRKEN